MALERLVEGIKFSIPGSGIWMIRKVDKEHQKKGLGVPKGYYVGMGVLELIRLGAYGTLAYSGCMLYQHFAGN